MPRFAAGTTVSKNKTREQIESLLLKYGATSIFTNDVNEQNILWVAWIIDKRPYKFEMPLPERDAHDFKYTATGKDRHEDKVIELWQQAVRQYWRIAREYIYMLHEILEATGMEFHEAFAPLLALKGGGNVWMAAALQADET